MSRDRDPFPRYHGRVALTSEVVEQAEALLARWWDPAGVLATAMRTRAAGPDPTRPRTLADAAREACGILAAGGPETQVSGYLKREELAVLAAPADDVEQIARRERRQRVALALWRLVRGISHPSDGTDTFGPEAG
jgi:hypothetical protein